MQDKIDYYTHQVYNPSYYYRQYENDLPENPESHSYVETGKRVVHLALPFLSLHQPFGRAISLTMGSVRMLTESVSILTADTMGTRTFQVMQLGLASLALAGTLYHFTLGLFLTSLADLTTNLIHLLKDLTRGQYKEAFDELLQGLTSTLYLAIMVTGSLEIVLASILVQALVSFYQARDEWAKGRMPEAIAKSLMGMIRLHQAHAQFETIQRRNELMKHYQEIVDRIRNGRKIDHLWDHPLIKQAELDQGILTDADGNEYDFGAHFYGYGKGQVKGMNITLRKDGDQTTLDFKINHVFRKRLQELLNNLENTSQEDFKDLFKIFGSHIEDISIQKKKFSSEYHGSAYNIHLKGLGTITVGASKSVVTLYDKISVKMDSGKNLYDFHEALSFFNLDDALRQSASEDIERMKIGHLLHMFCKATAFERSDPFFDLPLDAFKQKVTERFPEMHAILDKWLPQMELRETLPGRMRWAVNGLSDDLTANGARGLTAALTGAWTEKEWHERIASMLKMGMISSEMRHDAQMGKKGLSSGLDYFTGGADSVFTQMVTETNATYGEFIYQAPIRFLISPKILENGSYQYHTDSFGIRFGWSYFNRSNIFDFLSDEKHYEHWWFNDNEVMIKDRIPPEFFTGIVVGNAQTKQNLVDYLRQKQIIKGDTIFSKPIDEFIWVGNTIKDEHFANTSK
ncbi:MAG: hypothetical protein K1000chlam2_00745 [Chlamydiae bacterium]|nr:hypothetical protein [Chlamydiota bacterium]